MNNNQPIFSVIMPAYNAERFITDAVNSVLNQTFHAFELIIVDDGSTDDTAKIIKSFNDQRIIYVNQKNSGVSAARNKAISLSRADWLTFLDSDDMWEEDTLSIFYSYKESHDFLIGGYSYLQTGKNKKLAYNLKNIGSRSSAIFDSLLDMNFIGVGAAAFRKNITTRYFDESLKFAEDYKLWLQLLSKKVRVKLINKRLYYYRIHSGSALQNTSNQELQLAEIINEFSDISSKAKQIASARYNNYLSYEIAKLSKNNISGRKFPEASNYNISLKNKLKLLAYKVTPRIINKKRVGK